MVQSHIISIIIIIIIIIITALDKAVSTNNFKN